MNETTFWALIEQAWLEISPTLFKKRLQIAEEKGEKYPTDLGMELSDVASSDLVENLTEKLRPVSKDDLLVFDRILERKMYDIDCAELYEYTAVDDESFMHSRAFVVAMGEKYYELLKNEPDRATCDLDAEDFCYFAKNLYEELYGTFPTSDISRETESNTAGWED